MNVYERDWPIVEVEWVDSASIEGWTEYGVMVKPSLLMRSVGYLFEDSPERVTLVTSLSRTCIDYQFHIPRAAVTSIVYLWDGEDE